MRRGELGAVPGGDKDGESFLPGAASLRIIAELPLEAQVCKTDSAAMIA